MNSNSKANNNLLADSGVIMAGDGQEIIETDRELSAHNESSIADVESEHDSSSQSGSSCDSASNEPDNKLDKESGAYDNGTDKELSSMQRRRQ